MAPSRTVTVFLNLDGTQELPSNLIELPAVILSVGEDLKLGRVADLAEASAGVIVPERQFLFSSPVLDNGSRILAAVPTALVDEDGLLRWKSYPYDFSTNTLADLQRSREAGVFEGDPDVFVVDRRTVGNGGWVGLWQDVVNALQALGSVGDGLGYLFYYIPVGVWKLGRRLRRQGKEKGSYVPTDSREAMLWLSSFFERRYPTWVEQGAASATAFLDTIGRHQSWHAESLAQMIQIAPAEARILLTVLGYEPHGKSGTFHLSTDLDRRKLRRQVLRTAVAIDPFTYEPLAQPSDENEDC